MNRRNLLWKVLSTAALTLLTVCAHCQNSITDNSIVRTSLDNMFKNLDKTKVPTGLLLDYAVDIVDFDNYKGIELTDSNVVTSSTLEDILNSVNSASVTEKKPAGDVSSFMTSQNNANTVSLLVALFRYNYIKANVLEDGLLNYNESTEQVSDAYKNGVWQNPYAEEYITAFAPSVEMKSSLNVTYSLKDACFLTNVPDGITIRFDAGDGSGYRKVNISDDISVSYSESGVKELKLCISTGSRTLKSHSRIFVEQRFKPAKKDTLNYQCVKELISNGEKVKGQMSCYFVNGESLTKPFIVVEGFDPWEYLELTENENVIENGVHLASTNHKNFYENEFSCLGSYLTKPKNEYDLIYIDWENSTADIRANAALLMEFIREVNKMKEEVGCEEPNIIMGQSMGGLVARYALCKMEKDRVDHEVCTFISHDTPHLGANIPLGGLYFAQQMLSFMHGNRGIVNVADLFSGGKLSKEERAIYSILHSKAARQMLINYVSPSMNLDNSVHDEWQQELNFIGFPKHTENLSIVNGRAFQQELAYDSHYLYVDGSVKTRFLADMIASFFRAPIMSEVFAFLHLAEISSKLALLGSNKVSFNAEVNPLSSANSGKVLSEITVKYTKKYLWFISKTYTMFHDKRTVPPGVLYYDDMPGSTYMFDEKADTTVMKEEFDKNALGKYYCKLGHVNKIMFIPSASALGVGTSGKLDKTSSMTDFYTEPPSLSASPFDSYFICDTAAIHIAIGGDIFDWIKDQMELKISGPQRAETGAKYQVPGLSGVKWYTSDLTKAIINSSGELHVIGSGSVEIIAEKYENGRMYRARKNIIVDFPDMLLDCSYNVGKGYVSTVHALNKSDMEFIENMVESGLLKYEWSIINGDGIRSTIESNDNTYSFIPDEKGVSTISVRLVEGETKGELYSLTIDDKSIFKLDHPYVIVNSEGTVILAKDGDVGGSMTADDKFAVKFNAMPTTDGSDMLEALALMKTEGCNIRVNKKLTFGITIEERGNYSAEGDRWEFDFFNSPLFLNALKTAKESKEDKIIGEYSISVYDSTDDKKLQSMTFTVYSKPDFLVIKPLPKPDPDIPIIRPFE